VAGVVVLAFLTITLALVVAIAVFRLDAATAARRERLQSAQLVQGKVEPGDLPSLVGPVTGKSAVWLQVEVLEDRGESFSSLFAVTESQPFAVVDAATGARVEIETPRHDVRGPAAHETTGPVVGVSTAMQELLARHGHGASSDGFTRRREYRERGIYVGETLFVVGTRRLAAGGQPDAVDYRIARASERSVLAPEWLARPAERDAFEKEIRVGPRLVQAFGVFLVNALVIGLVLGGIGSCIRACIE
jgi:hypothetical protein